MAMMLFAQREGRELNGLMSIASYVDPSHETRVIIPGDDLEKVREGVKRYSPQVVGIPIMTKDHFWGLDVARAVKEVDPRIVTIAGGPHPTFYTKILKEDGLDAICVGEGERAVKGLLDRVDKGEDYSDVQSLHVKKKDGTIVRNKHSPLLKRDEIPVPKRGIYQRVDGVMETSDLLVMASRGCPFDCNFCANYALRKMYKEDDIPLALRLRDPEAVIDEIKRAQSIRPRESISFEDDIFGLNKRWLTEFHKLYNAQVNLPFYALLRFDILNDELMEQLKDMGCQGVAVGIESGNEKLRNNLLGKHLSDEQIFRGTEVLHRHDMPFNTYVMFGLPGETFENALESIDINLKVRANVAYSQIFHPYPGTKFFEIGGEAVERAIISRDFDRFKTNYPYNERWEDIQRLQKWAMAAVSYPELRPLLPTLATVPLDRPYDKFSLACWEDIYDTQKRKGFKKK